MISTVDIKSCDIFCNVIDNYGDIGVCWRLSRQLVNEHRLKVRLWIDDLGSFARLCPEVDVALGTQQCRGVEVRHWTDDTFRFFVPELSPGLSATLSRERERINVASLVIEAFACKLPETYVAAMAAQVQQPIWINLEYLSAEDWVESHHKLPSPHPILPLTKYFFFPGFTKRTGGVLLERDLLARRDVFQGDAAQQQAFWKSLGMEMPGAETLKISLFGYENNALPGLFDAWVASAQTVLCLVPEGRILPQVRQYFDDTAPYVGKAYSRGNLQVRVLPFVEQERYDELLWACDVNCVRGEDSFVRAQWAGRPCVWQIYPQHDTVHLKKLQAFLTLYCHRLGLSTRQAVTGLWQEWNTGGEAAGQLWAAFIAARSELDGHARYWARQLAENNLALNLLDFCQEIGRMRALEIEGQ